MATLEELRERVRTSVDDSGLEADYVDQKLREGLHRVTPYLKLLNRASTEVVVGTTNYSLPTDLYSLVIVHLGDTQLWGRDGDYEILGGMIVLDDSLVEETDTLTITYYRKPIEWVAGAEPDGIPEEWSDLLELYAVAEVLMREEGLDEYVVAQQKFDARLREFISWSQRNRAYKVKKWTLR